MKSIARKIIPGPVRSVLNRHVFARGKRSANIEPGKQFATEIGYWVGGFKGKRVLEIGSDLAGRNLRAALDMGALEAVGVNPAFSAIQYAENFKVISEDARKLSFADDHFDIVISDSALEHVHGLPEVLNEIQRVTRPGGFFYAHYGPIWSTPYGHHLWAGAEQTYWKILLPPWCHLLDDDASLRFYCTQTLSLEPDVVETVIDWIRHSDKQNQLLFDDYREIVNASSWEIEFFKGYDHPELSRKYLSVDMLDRHRELQRRWPKRSGWLYDGIKMLLSA